MIHLNSKDFEFKNQSFSTDYDRFIKLKNDMIHKAKCPHCSKDGMIFYGKYKRKIILPSGKSVIIMVQRCQCVHCGHVHAILPDFVLPYHNHLVRSITNFIRQKFSILERSYVRRMIHIFSEPLLLSWPNSHKDMMEILKKFHKFDYSII